ncbi:MAG TPA: fructosamine kinase family protein [Chitinophagaceae bacterium]
MNEIPSDIKIFLEELFHARDFSFIKTGGGCINQTYHVSTGKQRFFLKFNSAQNLRGLLDKEKNGLDFISKQQIIKTPSIISFSENKNRQLMLLEWINNKAATPIGWQTFGKQLAALHQVTNENFGFDEDNFIGSLPQQNQPAKDWIHFFIESRLKPQVSLALKNDYLQLEQLDLFEKLYQKIPAYFEDEKPSLLHGDLWSGNFIFNENDQPVLIDPAVYFGHRSMDLAMTKLFGGFEKSFYEAYDYHFPLPKNHLHQWTICNLYPLLVHLNIFGSAYYQQVNSILKLYS